MTELADYLRLLFADAPPGSLVDLRSLHGETMRQTFLPTSDLDAVAVQLERLTRAVDVYVGVLPRRRLGGGRGDLVAAGRLAWVDLDRPDAGVRLAGFAPAPTLVVASGSLGHRHAYWQLRSAVAITGIELLNRRLALELGGDEASAEPARILRPPGTRSHKHRPPAAARAVIGGPGAPVVLAELESGLPPLPPDARTQERRFVSPRTTADALRRVAPAVYVRALTGKAPNRAGKVRCPLHDDQRPSLHVYPDPSRGWFCFGCRQGGSVYDLAAALWQRPTAGPDFVALRRDLTALLRGDHR